MISKILHIKPMSVNEAWQGKRYKTDAYKWYTDEIVSKLMKEEVYNGKLEIIYEFGFSSVASDVDNPVKVTTDILQKFYGFNDNMVYKLTCYKTIVPKGQEFIKFKILPYYGEPKK